MQASHLRKRGARHEDGWEDPQVQRPVTRRRGAHPQEQACTAPTGWVRVVGVGPAAGSQSAVLPAPGLSAYSWLPRFSSCPSC